MRKSNKPSSTKKPKNDWWDLLTPSQIKGVQEGLRDLKKGRYLSNEEFWSRYKK